MFSFQAGIPENKKKALLRLQVQRWAPFPNVKYVAQWVGNRASVYAWNDNEVKSAIAESGLSERRCVVCPETFIRTPAHDGVRLAAAIDGFEAQVWQQGFLAFTRWWPQKPSQTEWNMFLRSAGVPLDQTQNQVPEPSAAEFLESPWTQQGGYLGITWSLLEDPRYAAAVATVVAAPFIYLGVEYLTLAIANARVENAIATLSVETQGVRQLRSKAIANLDEIEDYLGLEIYPSHFETMTTALGLLQSLNVKILEWTYDVGALSFTLRPEREIDATFLITAFERSGAFANVTAARAGDVGQTGQASQIRVRLDILPKQIKSVSR